MAVISIFCSDETLSQRALELEEALTGVVLRGDRIRGGWMRLGPGLEFKQRVDGRASGEVVNGGWQMDGRVASKQVPLQLHKFNVGRRTDRLSFEHKRLSWQLCHFNSEAT